MKNLSDLRIYILSVEVSEMIWGIIDGWKTFAKWTVGKQIVESADSISSNIIEGYYRYSKADQRKFMQYAFASAKETELWLWKAKNRKLIKQKDYDLIKGKMENLLPQILNYIKNLK